MPATLSMEELERYDRQLLIAEIGAAGQAKLKRARVVVCGAGGLGSPVAIYLAAAGVGTITIVDHDRVSLSNLNRQVLHGEGDMGRSKVASAKAALGRLNSQVVVNSRAEAVTASNVHALVDGHDVIIDAVDNVETRHLLNRAALDLGIPFIHGAVNGFEGRILTIVPGRSTCLRCLYRGPVAPVEKLPVIGTVPAVIGALQATEAIKAITGIGELLTDRLLTFDGLKLRWREFTVRKNPHCDHCGSQPERTPS